MKNGKEYNTRSENKNKATKMFEILTRTYCEHITTKAQIPYNYYGLHIKNMAREQITDQMYLALCNKQEKVKCPSKKKEIIYKPNPGFDKLIPPVPMTIAIAVAASMTHDNGSHNKTEKFQFCYPAWKR